MATLKLSQIAFASSPPLLTDTVVGVQQSGPNDLQYTISQLSSTLGVPIGANPTATASNTAVNGSATTFMRSDAAPAIQLTSSSVFGLCKVDGTTITASGGVITSVTGAASLVIGTTTISGGVAGGILYDSGPGILEESSNLTFNGSNTVKLNGAIALINLPAINNFFDGGAGNTTVTGASNFATGTGALASLTSGSQNAAVGVNALNQLTTGNHNFAVGFNALQGTITGGQNVAVGTNALAQMTTGDFCTAIGDSSMRNVTSSGGSDIAVGNQALGATTSTGGNNIGIGAFALDVVTGQSNAGIGELSGDHITSGNFNTVLAWASGSAITTGSGNVILGGHVGAAAINNCIILSDGGSGSGGTNRGDYNFTNSNKWTLQTGLNLAYVSNSGILVTDSSGNVTENNTTAAATVTANFTADHRLQVTLGGTTYYIAMSTTPW